MSDFSDKQNRQTGNSGPRPLGDILKQLASVPNFNGAAYVDDAVRTLITKYQGLKAQHSEHAIAGMKLRIAEGSLLEQLDRLAASDPARGALADLAIDTWETHRMMINAAAGDSTEVKEQLCDYLVYPGIPELRRYFAKELLLMHAHREGADEEMRDHIRLAECLVPLERPLKTATGDGTLDELRDLTKQPDLWLAVYENLETMRGSNLAHVLPILKENLEHTNKDVEFAEWLCEGLLQNHFWLKRIITTKLPSAHHSDPPSASDEPEIDASDL